MSQTTGAELLQSGNNPVDGRRRWAIDANIAMQQGIRRLISGCAEFAGDELVIPVKVLELIPTRYRRIARTRAKRITKFTGGRNAPTTEEIETMAATRTIGMSRAFAEWASNETRRNDGLWTLAPESARGELIVERMIQVGIARIDASATAEEDAIVAGQAIAAKCRWIASNNLEILGGEIFERWLENERTMDEELASADVPLVLRPDEAINTILARHYDQREDRRLVTSIAWELCRPNDPGSMNPKQRIDNLERFANAIEAGGAAQAARAIRITLDATKRAPEPTAKLLEARNLGGLLERTRRAEERQASAEREIIVQTQREAMKRKRTAEQNAQRSQAQ